MAQPELIISESGSQNTSLCLESSGGKMFRLTVDESGTLITTEVV